MPPLEALLPFCVACVLCNVTPGPDVLGILSYGVSGGRWAGVGFAVGVGCGLVLHTSLAVVGLSALLASSPIAFRGALVAGAVYLIWLGVQTLRGGGSFDGVASSEERSTTGGFRRAVLRGFLTNALNPKAALFFLAFLPQFVDASRDVGPQLAVLGLAFTVWSTCLYSCFGWFAGSLGEWLKTRAAIGRWIDRATGCLFVGLGLHLLNSARKVA